MMGFWYIHSLVLYADGTDLFSLGWQYFVGSVSSAVDTASLA